MEGKRKKENGEVEEEEREEERNMERKEEREVEREGCIYITVVIRTSP